MIEQYVRDVYVSYDEHKDRLKVLEKELLKYLDEVEYGTNFLCVRDDEGGSLFINSLSGIGIHLLDKHQIKHIKEFGCVDETRNY